MDTTINNEYPAVAQALDTYYDGLYYGNTEMLREISHPDAHYVCGVQWRTATLGHVVIPPHG